jgi:hypothetical protein
MTHPDAIAQSPATEPSFTRLRGELRVEIARTAIVLNGGGESEIDKRLSSNPDALSDARGLLVGEEFSVHLGPATALVKSTAEVMVQYAPEGWINIGPLIS